MAEGCRRKRTHNSGVTEATSYRIENDQHEATISTVNGLASTIFAVRTASVELRGKAWLTVSVAGYGASTR
jgi:hypothetical protein